MTGTPSMSTRDTDWLFVTLVSQVTIQFDRNEHKRGYALLVTVTGLVIL